MGAVFFDLDGTLADTRVSLASAVNATRVELGLGELDLDTVISHVGRGAKYLLEHAIPERSPTEESVSCFQRNYAAHATDRVELYPGVEKTLAELHRRGWRLGVNTNKPRFATDEILKHFALTEYFGAAVVAGGDLAELKPSAAPLWECARRMGNDSLSPADWMVGDNWTDLDCAKNAGIGSVFCTFGFGQLKESRYSVKIDRFEELLSILS